MAMGADLSVAILYSRISRPKTSHKPVRNLLRQWKRYTQITKELGWKMLAILSFSASFRQHALVMKKLDWDRFLLDLRNLKVSIELVGDFFCPDWCELLPFMMIIGEPMPAAGYHGHHHLWSVPLDEEALAAQPVAPYEILEKSIPGAGMVFDRDPRIWIKETTPPRNTLEGHCPICMKGKLECECPTHKWFPCRIELIQTEDRGVGVRALQVS